MDTLKTLAECLNECGIGDIVTWESDIGETFAVGKGKKCWHFAINGEIVGCVRRNKASKWECWKAGNFYFIGLYNYVYGYEWSAHVRSPRGELTTY